jgi:alpha-galactosidase
VRWQPSTRLRVRFTNAAAIEVPAPVPAAYDVGPLRITLAGDEHDLQWSATAREPVSVDAIALVWDAGAAGDAPRLFSHGYQSWSPTRTLRLGVDADPSQDPSVGSLLRSAFHADPTPTAPDELRSEQVAVLARTGALHECIGFVGGERHAGTVRARIDNGNVELAIEAWLGGAQLQPDAPSSLHGVRAQAGEDATGLLESWATDAGAAAGARVHAPFIAGWCSWYQYFHDVTERAVRANLSLSDEWPFDVFQLDDGFQHAIGDWLRPNSRFPSGIDALAADIDARGRTPGIWIAPFLAALDSDIAADHAEWLVRAPHRDTFAIGMHNAPWGGAMAILDTTRPDVLEHLEATASALVAMGYRYLKLDFTFAPAMRGRFDDPSQTPAQRVRAGYDAIRRGAGSDTYILACGAPIGAVVGAVDAMRIGADVAPAWRTNQTGGYAATTPATQNAFINTCTRSFMHRRLWVNDPDCVMLRTSDTELPEAVARVWAQTVACSGGLVLLSDDLARLDSAALAQLREVIALARVADDDARLGRSPRADGLLDPSGPHGLASAAGSVRVDLGSGIGDYAPVT